MKLILNISRILVGTLFIFSGLIKANDPLGFSYKLEEYWVEFGMAWDWLLAIGVPLASFIVIFEVVLGVAVLVGYRMNLVSRLLLLMIVFFSILTFASAVFGLVKSCGCFGDAIPLTPWDSFIKDLILLVFIVILFGYKKSVVPESSSVSRIPFLIFPVVLMAYTAYLVDWTFPLYFTLIILGLGFVSAFVVEKHAPVITVALSLVGTIWLCYQSIEHLPMRDFRPYAVGLSISEQMQLPEGAKPDIYENIFMYKNKTTGEVEEFDDSNYPWDDENYEFVDRVTNLVEKGDEAKITDFSIVDTDGFDLTEDVLNDPDPVLLVICYNLEKSEDDNGDLSKLISTCNAKGLSAIGLSASSEELISEYTANNNLELSFYSTDEITLKTIIRSNPGLMLLKEGVIMGKWHMNDIPSFDELKAAL